MSKTADFLKPIPTEYAGKTFRSKCEAIFARNLDLMDPIGEKWFWSYEPWGIKADDGWVPDFRLTFSTGEPMHWIIDLIIEYKPNDVSEAYKELFITRCNSIASKNQVDFSFSLVCGSPFNDTRIYYDLVEGKLKESELERDSFFKNIEEAAEYRFDLKH